MSNPHEQLVYFVLEKSQSEPVQKRIVLYTALRDLCGNEDEANKLTEVISLLRDAEARFQSLFPSETLVQIVPDHRDSQKLSPKDALKRKGWSYREAAPVLGVTYQHLSEVLNGKRISRRLLAAIAALPKKEPSK